MPTSAKMVKNALGRIVIIEVLLFVIQGFGSLLNWYTYENQQQETKKNHPLKERSNIWWTTILQFQTTFLGIYCVRKQE